MTRLVQLVIGSLLAGHGLAKQILLSSQNNQNNEEYGISNERRLDLLTLHRQLIEIESVSGQEQEVGDWLFLYLKKHGMTVEKQYVADDRFNVFAYPGNSNKTDILLSSHIDTVPPFFPYEFVEPNEIWGRGSVDAKACVAAQIIAVIDTIESHYATSTNSTAPPSIGLLFVVGEETSGQGMKFFSAHKPTNYSAVVFGEPTEAKLATGHKGMISFTLEVKGRAAHSGYPWLGLSATNVLIEALGELRKLEGNLPRSPKLGDTTVNIGKIEGGVAANVVAEHASAVVAIRIATGTPQQIETLVNEAFRHIKTKTEKDGGTFSVMFSDRAYGPVHLDTDIQGFETIGVNYGTDVPNLEGHHKKYLYGPGSILVAHGPNEHLTTDDLEDAVIAYKRIVIDLLGRQTKAI